MHRRIEIFDELGNQLAFNTFKFPGGELQVRVPSKFKSNIACISALPTCSEDILSILLIADALKRVEPLDIFLRLKYLPYARQDRVCAPGEALSISVIANLINSAGFKSVVVDDPHSDVAVPLINNCYVNTQEKLFRGRFHSLMKPYFDATLVSPDSGASKKIRDLTSLFNHKPYIQASKVRDVKTGEILETTVEGNVEGKTLLIVDDICDGGRTFIELAKVLRAKGAKKIGLYVTHGIFSKGKDVLLEYIDDIYCYHDWTDYA